MSMAAFGLFMLAKTGPAAINGVPPEPLKMGVVAVLALLANGAVALMLYALRDGDTNMRSVWLCSRNDAIGNVAGILSAAGVFCTGSVGADLVVAVIMAGLALSSGVAIVRKDNREGTVQTDSTSTQLKSILRKEEA